MSSFDLFNTRHELIKILAGLPAAFAALAAPAPAACRLLVLSKFGFRLSHGSNRF